MFLINAIFFKYIYTTNKRNNIVGLDALMDDDDGNLVGSRWVHGSIIHTKQLYRFKKFKIDQNLEIQVAIGQIIVTCNFWKKSLNLIVDKYYVILQILKYIMLIFN